MKKIVSKYSFNDSFTEKTMLSKTIPIRGSVWTGCYPGRLEQLSTDFLLRAPRSHSAFSTSNGGEVLCCAPQVSVMSLAGSTVLVELKRDLHCREDCLSGTLSFMKFSQNVPGKGSFWPSFLSVGCLGRDSLRNRWSYFKTFKKNS